jgi:hypothetical protein
MAAIEAPGMIARIPLIGKLSSAALPLQSYFVFGHLSYMECGQALGNQDLDLRFSPACIDGCLRGEEQRSPLLSAFGRRDRSSEWTGISLQTEHCCEDWEPPEARFL